MQNAAINIGQVLVDNAKILYSTHCKYGLIKVEGIIIQKQTTLIEISSIIDSIIMCV